MVQVVCDGERGGDIYFATVLASAMSMSLACDVNEWKMAGRALVSTQNLQLQQQARIGHKQLCVDSGWQLLETVSS